MYFGLSPTAGAILALILVFWLIGRGFISAGKKISRTGGKDTMTLKEIRKALGTTWKDEVLGFIIIFMLAAIVACIINRLVD